MKLTGRQIQLDEKRSVFVGRADEDDGCTYIKFVNHEGDETRIKITQDARAALLKLLVNDGVFVRQSEGNWIVVSGEAPE